MATGIAPAALDDLIDWMCNISGATQPAEGIAIQWHDGDPGAAGTSNVCANLSFPALDSLTGPSPYWESDTTLGWAKNTGAGESSAATGAATVSYFSIWSSTSSTTFLFSGTTTSQTLSSGGKVSYGAGDLVVKITGAA